MRGNHWQCRHALAGYDTKKRDAWDSEAIADTRTAISANHGIRVRTTAQGVDRAPGSQVERVLGERGYALEHELVTATA
ncbi:hypothetical protein MRX96_023444 [Rhipicephalus microplus]